MPEGIVPTNEFFFWFGDFSLKEDSLVGRNEAIHEIAHMRTARDKRTMSGGMVLPTGAAGMILHSLRCVR